LQVDPRAQLSTTKHDRLTQNSRNRTVIRSKHYHRERNHQGLDNQLIAPISIFADHNRVTHRRDCAVGYYDPAFRHHPNEVAIAQPIGDVPANAQPDDFSVEHPAAADGSRAIGWVIRNPLLEPESYGKAHRCTGACARITWWDCPRDRAQPLRRLSP
jgi:hypothetical protein